MSRDMPPPRSGSVLKRLIAAFGLAGFVAVAALATAPEAGLSLRVLSSSPAHDDPAKFQLEAVFHNRGDSAVVILPAAMRRSYTASSGGTARYLPYPGPPIAPWQGAFLLRPGERHALEFTGMRDGDGIWNLDPGDYELALRLHVTPEFAHAAEQHAEELGATVWVGELLSAPIAVRFAPVPADQPR